MSLRMTLTFAFLLTGFVSTNMGQEPPLVRIETVQVTHPGNPPDVTGYGAVGCEYRLGKHEVSLSAYTAFLNAVAASDPYLLYNPAMGTDPTIVGIRRTGESGSFAYEVIGDGDRPVSYVSWYDAARFCNWLHNGGHKGSDTEDGCYPLNGARTGIIEKHPQATWWIPTENEWYKAAYYQPASEGGDTDGYWLFGTASNNPPGQEMGDQPNQANYWGNETGSGMQTFEDRNYLTVGGAFSGSSTFFGTYDQTGNVWEWVDIVIENSRGLRGGGWNNPLSYQPATFRHGPFGPGNELREVGFRLATRAEEK